ncbi:MAG: phosphotransferase [Clostridia bacterium]|nr:phosphotransferase [Clostridia bacterium]
METYSIDVYLKFMKEKLNINASKVEKINKGTLSEVYLIDGKYILKIADPVFIKRERFFFKKNHSEYNEKLIYSDRKNRFIVFEYIKGNGIKEMTEKSANANLNIIINMTQNYKKTYRKRYGYIYEDYDSWYDFLKSEIEFNNIFLPQKFRNTEENIVYKALSQIKNSKIDSRYIHGDLGAHNIIFDNQTIKGIIDPTTAVGDYRYDIIYYIFSSSKIEKFVDYDRLIDFLGKEIINLIIILLYSRISKLYKYHSEEKEKKYFETLWYRLKNSKMFII